MSWSSYPQEAGAKQSRNLANSRALLPCGSSQRNSARSPRLPASTLPVFSFSCLQAVPFGLAWGNYSKYNPTNPTVSLASCTDQRAPRSWLCSEWGWISRSPCQPERSQSKPIKHCFKINKFLCLPPQQCNSLVEVLDSCLKDVLFESTMLSVSQCHWG